MRKIMIWLRNLVLGMIIVILLVVAGAWTVTQYRVNKVYDIPQANIAIPTDAASIERGRYLATAMSTCTGCHGQNLAGKFFFDDPAIGQIYSANLTAGAGGKGATYTDADWVRALRHGVGPDGKALMIMPAQNFVYLSDSDLVALIAYLKTISPVDQDSPEPKLTFMAEVMFGLGALGKMPAEMIDHAAPPPAPPAPAIDAAYGEYIRYVSGCHDCHGADLTGGTVGPNGPPAPNLTPGGQLLVWTEEDFIRAFRTGQTPQGEMDTELMPIADYQMTDDDLRALFRYLQSLPASQTK
jgi:mono/diheme cytochrome c family protein